MVPDPSVLLLFHKMIQCQFRVLLLLPFLIAPVDVIPTVLSDMPEHVILEQCGACRIQQHANLLQVIVAIISTVVGTVAVQACAF